MERQAWKLIVLLLLFCYVHSPYVKAQVGNGKQVTILFSATTILSAVFQPIK